MSNDTIQMPEFKKSSLDGSEFWEGPCWECGIETHDYDSLSTVNWLRAGWYCMDCFTLQQGRSEIRYNLELIKSVAALVALLDHYEPNNREIIRAKILLETDAWDHANALKDGGF